MSVESFWSWGLPLGSLRGIRIRLHWVLLLWWAFELNSMLRGAPSTRSAIGVWGLYVLTTFLVILLHEFGHCFAARAVGGEAEDVLLWPLGGLAFCRAPNLWLPQLLVVAGGPLVNVAIFLIAWPAFAIADSLSPGSTDGPYIGIVRWVLCTGNLYLLLFNSVPLYPLDGGRLLQNALWGYYQRRSGGGWAPGAYGRATLITLWASRVTGGLGILYAVYECIRTKEVNLLLFCIFIWCLAETQRLQRQLQEGPEQDDSFGYDFSRGYTSLGDQQRPGGEGAAQGWLARVKARLARRRRARKRQAEQPRRVARTEAERKRIDEILAKISREGMVSLTEEERRFLEETSRRWAE